ncbi:MAG: phage tail protein [Hungatella sp.]|nr:phage tail protein [Hungatella sp.]
MATKGVITAIGRKKLCKAHAGDITLSPIKYMAWGDAGVDAEGQPVIATGNEIALYNQLLKKEIEGHIYVTEEEATWRYTATLEAGELTGKEISEMGLFDEEGDLIAYRTFMRKGKDADIPQIYDMDEIF